MAIIIININIIIIIVIIMIIIMIIIMFIIIEYSQEVPMLKNSLSYNYHITISNSILVEHCNINWCRLRLSITLIWR